MEKRSILAFLLCLILLLPSLSPAELTRLEILRVEPFAGGASFGQTGPYEKLIGRAYGEIDPRDPLNQVIAHIDKAPLNSRGRVEYSMEVHLLKAADLSRWNRRIFYDVNNRGNKRILMFFNDGRGSNDPSTSEHAGNGFLMRQGYVIVWSGWAGDVEPSDNRLLMNLPVATDSGKPLVGLVWDEWRFDNTTTGKAKLSLEAASLDQKHARLYARLKEQAPRQVVPPTEWRYVDRQTIELPGKFRQSHIYEFVYYATNPKIMGIGYAATRDLISFLRYEAKDRIGRPNPLVSPGAERAYVWGRSQAGRWQTDFLYYGFNEDERHRIVFDGMMPHVTGASRAFVNYPFAQPSRSGLQERNHHYPEREFPFTYTILTDPVTGKTDGWLRRCLASKTCPKILHSDSSNEYWQKAASLLHTDPSGRDIELPENVRFYHFSSTQHNTEVNDRPRRRICKHLSNPLYPGPFHRALAVALDEWVTKGVEPPPSRYGRVVDGTLVSPDRASTGFPLIPGAHYTGIANHVAVLDSENAPPVHVAGKSYPVFVPKVDRDGNEVTGIRLPELQVPVATHTGWNPRAAEYAENEGCTQFGSYFPFHRSRVEREAAGDPRLSLEERYGNQNNYARKLLSAAESMVRERLLLEEDVGRILIRAVKDPVWGRPKEVLGAR
jgi:hypothetical protein